MHLKAKLLSIQQRRYIQLLSLIFIHMKNHVGNRIMKSAKKYVFAELEI